MQFVSDGPDIPDALLQAHEEGRVVFFCGAGISYPAGLPGFKGLVEKIYELTGTGFDDIERDAFNREQYDATLDLLERRLPGQRLTARRAMEKVLKPKLKRKGSLDTHAALLRLSRSRQGAIRLVTTNFDRVFHSAAKRTGQAFAAYSAPMLPVPKNSRWNGLVYLHGLLQKNNQDADLNRLVVTSGDFGLAYLTERWAARFVSEMFRNYVVCFVGYSINDPVLRYMMDALAADRMLGEVTPQAWALGDCEPGKERQKTIEWESKGVTPILYSVPAGSFDHSSLHKTLHIWADTYRDGVQGKEAIVVKHALARPQSSTMQDNFVGRVLWALSDKSGLPAKRFAEFSPAPSIDWLLEPFSGSGFRFSDLRRFNVPPHDVVDENLKFSLVQRPAPYDFSPSMALVSTGATEVHWDEVMFQLAKWLVRHLDDPRLILWVAECGGHLHGRLPWLIEQELQRFSSLESEGRFDELNDVKLKSPRAIPRPQMRTLWRLLLSQRAKLRRNSPDFYRWRARLRSDGLTFTARADLREMLAPQILMKRPFSLEDNESGPARSDAKIRNLVDFELVLATDHVRSVIDSSQDDSFRLYLPHLIEDFQILLRDALDILKEVGEADDRNDRSHWDMPSIDPHPQNRGYREWVVLIELVRDAWLEVLAAFPARALSIGLSWFDIPYPAFKRLSLFAASRDRSIASDIWVGWLLSDNCWWLWSSGTGREVFRLIVLRGQQMDRGDLDRLEAAILAGPPREMYRRDLDEDAWLRLVTRSVWLRLAKLNQSGALISARAAECFNEISIANPSWILAKNEREEFSTWMSGTGDPDFEEERRVDIAPRKRSELGRWLAEPVPENDPLYEDTWRDVCQTRFYAAFAALCDLSSKGIWPASRWRDALNVWAEERLASRSWRYAAHVVLRMPKTVFDDASHAVTRWMESVSKSIQIHEDVMLELINRIMGLGPDPQTESVSVDDDDCADDSFGSAINHPVGNAAQALINLWFAGRPSDNDLIAPEFKPIFTALCDTRIVAFKHARVLLSAQLIAFFRVDRSWTQEHLLPLLDWNNSSEARGAWHGFLWSPRLYPPLMVDFKANFLDCSSRYNELGEHQQQFSSFLTYAAIAPLEGYDVTDFRRAFASLPKKGLEESAQALYYAVEAAGSQSGDYWRNRASPFLQEVWPKSRGLATSKMSDSFAHMAVAAGDEFPMALRLVSDWIGYVEYPDSVIRSLNTSGLCARYPAESLELLDAVINDPYWVPDELGTCMKDIRNAMESSALDARFQRIDGLIRKANGR